MTIDVTYNVPYVSKKIKITKVTAPNSVRLWQDLMVIAPSVSTAKQTLLRITATQKWHSPYRQYARECGFKDMKKYLESIAVKEEAEGHSLLAKFLNENNITVLGRMGSVGKTGKEIAYRRIYSSREFQDTWNGYALNNKTSSDNGTLVILKASRDRRGDYRPTEPPVIYEHIEI